MKKLLMLLVSTAVLLAASIPAFGATAARDDKSGAVNAQLIKAVNFTDLKGHWAEAAIYKMANKGFVSGVGGGIFLPDRNMKKSEAAYLIRKAFGIQIAYFAATDITKVFDDVQNKDWYASALYDLVTANIVDDKGSFKPDSFITREELVHYMMNAYRYKGGVESPTKDLPINKFIDSAQVNAQYINDFNSALRLKVIFGKGLDTLKPRDLSTRAEVVVILDRLLSIGEKGDSVVRPVENSVRVEVYGEKSSTTYKMKLTIINDSKNKVTINHMSGQKFDFKLLDQKRNILFTWSADKMFAMALSSTTIEAGKSVEFTDSIDIKGLGDMMDKTYYLKAYIKGESQEFKIDPDGYEIQVK